MSLPNVDNALISSIQQTLDNDHIPHKKTSVTPDTTHTETMLAPSTMVVRVSKNARIDKAPMVVYPYHALPANSITYRGYPIDGAETLKRSPKWKIQIVSSHVGCPPAPLPQFPQQELLQRTPEGYRGVPPLNLTEQQAMYNSGEAWLSGNDDEKPRSEYFFAAGYVEKSGVKLQKPFPESIYRSVVAGPPVPVKEAKL